MENSFKLPVGVDNFEKIRKEGFYYVDKTRLIEQLLEQWGEVNLFTRPRRFGKTLNMSMLRCFFEIGADPSLFEGLYISGNKELCKTYMGKFPVIFLSLKNVDGPTFEAARYRLTELIGVEAEKFSFLLDSDKLTENEKSRYRALVMLYNGRYSMDEDILRSALQTMSRLLYKHYGKKTIILIDEYDGDDLASMEDNNTSCFNYRPVEGTSSLSKHALGLAIDINPFYNPYITYNKDGSEKVSPANASAYADRTSSFPYKIDENDLCYQLFKEHGFTWGGHWNSCKDYQHFQNVVE